MREILFRGKKVRGGEWLYGVPARGKIDDLTPEITLMISLAGFDARYHLIPNIEGDWVIPETVGQFTGLYDSRGNKVFEGDVLQFRKPDGSAPYKRTSIIAYGSWNCNCCDGIYGWYSEGQDCIRGLYESSDEIEGASGYVIIGNIHDNPELVKEETK